MKMTINTTICMAGGTYAEFYKALYKACKKRKGKANA